MAVAKEDPDPLWKALRMLGWSAVALILLAPAVAMRFTDEVNWTTSDFVFAGVLLIGGAAVIELVAWRVRNPLIRIGSALLVVAVVALIWIEGAVGILH
jgi:non-ribosomal peptide synthetase component E (peptide arylation enzyme)